MTLRNFDLVALLFSQQPNRSKRKKKNKAKKEKEKQIIFQTEPVFGIEERQL